MPRGADTGLAIQTTITGSVPEIECREAAVYVRVTWADWLEKMTPDDRARAVAHYRTQLQIKAHVEDAASRAAERKQRRSRARGSHG